MITSTNQATILPNIHFDNDTMSEIHVALYVGKVVTANSDPVGVLNWKGVGCIVDPDTGSGVYKIRGAFARVVTVNVIPGSISSETEAACYVR